jgi:hypothetical protein
MVAPASVASGSGRSFGGQCVDSGVYLPNRDTLSVAPMGIHEIAAGTYACICQPGFTSSVADKKEDCSKDVDECASAPCKNQGECKESGLLKVQGDFATVPAKNIASCVAFTYKGAPYSTGDCSYADNMNVPWCSLEVNADGTHKDGAQRLAGNDDGTWQVCHFQSSYDETLFDAYQCTCQAGYEGGNCELEVNECASIPCQNAGACKEPQPAEYFCQCAEGFAGENCGDAAPVYVEEEDSYWWIFVLVGAGLVFCLAICILCYIKRRRDKTFVFLVETLDKEDHHSITIEVEFRKDQTVLDLMAHLAEREGIPIIEQVRPTCIFVTACTCITHGVRSAPFHSRIRR